MQIQQYAQEFRFRNWSRQVTLFTSGISPSHVRRMLRSICPDFGRDEHRRAAMHFESRARRYQCLYDKALDVAAMRTLGRPFQFGDYRVSGIGRDEFDERDKVRLRRLCRLKNQCQDIARAHSLSGRLMKNS